MEINPAEARRMAEELEQFKRDCILLEEKEPELLEQGRHHHHAAAFKGKIYVAPTYGELKRLLEANNVDPKFAASMYILTVEERRNIVLNAEYPTS